MLSKVRKFGARSIAMLLLGTICACGQVEPPKTASSPAPDQPKAYCAAFETISFAELPPGTVDDVGNQADSKVTVASILAHNAVWFALCTDPLAAPR